MTERLKTLIIKYNKEKTAFDSPKTGREKIHSLEKLIEIEQRLVIIKELKGIKEHLENLYKRI